MRKILLFLLFFQILTSYAQQLRQWTNTEGRSFSGTIVDCDGETAKYKVFGRNKLVEIPLSQLCPADRRIAVIEAYKPKYEAALRHLKSEAAKTSKDVFLNKEHIPYLNDIGMYLKEIVKPVAEKFKPEGEFDESDDYWVRVHSGMVYFATTIADLSHHRIYDVIKGKRHIDVEGTLMSYKGREKVKVVCMDLSSGYRSIVRRCFPNAKIVADRFHVIRLVLYHFMEFCKNAQEEVKWKRSLTYPLRKRKERLKPHERERLKNFFKENPAIELAYEFKEKLCELLNKKSQTARQCKNNIKKLKEMMKTMRYEAPTEFGKLAETISEWFAPIIRMWRFTKNNGITEGFHRKMKLIQRLAYGYKNFENYRLRVLVQCGVFH